MIWNGDQKGIEGDAVNDTLTIENCTVHGMANYWIDSFHSQYIIRNTIATGNPSGDFVRLQADGSPINQQHFLRYDGDGSCHVREPAASSRPQPVRTSPDRCSICISS
jgi:hypothetical protein